MKLDLHEAPYVPLRAVSYIPTDPLLTAKKAIINVKNDEKCFVWFVLAGLHPQKFHSERVSKYVLHQNELNVKDLIFPLKVTDVKKFEKRNPSLSVNVFALENKTVYPVHLTISRDATSHVNLLIITSGDRWHYTLIKNITALLFCHTSKNAHKKHWCHYSLQSRPKNGLTGTWRTAVKMDYRRLFCPPINTGGSSSTRSKKCFRCLS